MSITHYPAGDGAAHGGLYKWATAAEPQDEKDTFIKEYRANRQSAVVSGLKGSPVVMYCRK
jgi:hypothetical protein